MFVKVPKLIKTPSPFHLLSSSNNPLEHSYYLSIGSFFLVPKARSRSLDSFSSACSARDLVDEFPQRGHQYLDDTRFYQVWNLIKASTSRPHTVNASTHHALALKLGGLNDVPTATSLLTAYARAGYLSSSRSIFNEILNRDLVAWNAMITACVDNQRFQDAVAIFQEMMKEGCVFDSTTLLVAISALSHMNDMKQGRVIHCLSLKAGMVADCFLGNALVDMYAKSADLSSSECMFAEIKYRDTTSWNSVMCGCLCNGSPEKSLWYFEEISYSGERPDNVSFSCAISSCSRLGDLHCGLVIHGLGIKLGYGETSHISVANSLISFYSRCGDIKAAETVFKGMSYRDVVSWNSLLDGLLENGKILESFDLLHEMQFMAGIQPDLVTVLTIISLCSELNLLQDGRAIHGFIIRREMDSDILLKNSLMDMYSKCYSIESAEVLFNTILERDLVSWNTMIAGYSQNKHLGKAKSLFLELLHSGPRCSLFSLLAILPSCNNLQALQFGKLIHCWHLKMGFSEEVLAVNALMLMYINRGDLVASFSLLQSNQDIADIASWNTVIVGCTQSGHFRESLVAFNLLRQEPHINPDSITFVSILSACGNLNLIMEGRFLHGLVVKTSKESDIHVRNALLTMYSRCRDIDSVKLVFHSSPYHNLCSWNCIISACSQNQDGRGALELFSCLQFEPNEMTMVSILSACTQIGASRHGRELHGHVIRLGINQNPFISSALVDMYSKCGRLDIAVQIFQGLPEKSVVCWNIMIAAYGFHGDGRKAIQLFEQMCETGAKATKSTFVSLLSACSHSGLIDEGYCYYNHMLNEFGIEPVTEHHVCIVDMLGRAGRLHEAHELIKQMPSSPPSGVWGALLSGCNYHGDLHMGKQVAELLFSMEPDNVGYYISLSNMFVAAGWWSDAVETRKMKQDKKLKKPPGFSLIDAPNFHYNKVQI
ncbi:PREDICTED: pentatricopeptide repeat-containing protein At4g19220, mitochondrial [Nelumbo nucifera]|uniref:Pentatricopeptide repeat-containing protein At4g19220, mitochondrial n=2 Tax=Nelumbo nucifera TaxID=4432 RepID=A0A822Y168_NELNU|nr:PREDICTED: pentatricopeptide repeat-containing protein At4g19220, mitochondrial [Nelumbo nucifera]DAD25029.1 TPA_asm: hypothetical protein HUJ06_026493 [Nelumbo nucifera]